jgi:hypothetical protein
LREVLAEAGVIMQEGIAVEQKLHELRRMYESYVQSLSAYLCMPLPAWFRATVALDSWQTSAWERIATGVTASPRVSGQADGHF